VERESPHSAERSAGDDRAGERGVVLLDIVLTVAVLLLTVRIVWPILPFNTSPARLMAWSHEIAALIEADRVQAGRVGHAVATRIDVRRKLFVGGTAGRTLQLPRDVGLDVLTTTECTVEPDRFALGFAPDGRSCGLSLTLTAPAGGATRVSVNWLTGLVEVTGGVRGRG
jgi:hypothetical protein